MDDIFQKALDGYVAYYENLSEDNVEGLRDLVDENIHFRDPFNDVRGVDAVVHIMGDMYRDTTDPSFEVYEVYRDGERSVMRWTFTCTPKKLAKSGPWVIDGMSYVSFNAAGLVNSHLDYWDAASQFYEKIPLLGSLIRVIKNRLKVDV